MRASPFKDEWQRCQVEHFKYLLSIQDLDNIATFCIVLRDYNIFSFVDSIEIPEQLAGVLPEVIEDKREEYLVRKGDIKRNKKQSNERKKRRQQRSTKNNYFWSPDQGHVVDKHGNLIKSIRMVDAFPETIERKEG